MESLEKNNLTLKEKFKNRDKIFGGWISLDHPSIAEIFALAEFDFISIDMEHAPISLNSAQNIISRTQSYGIPCLPRPVSHSNDIFKPLLDSGADGLIVQMVSNDHEVKEIINNLKYPPLGQRTYGVNRAHQYGFNFKKYTEDWNSKSIFIAQIESYKAIENIDHILDNEELDGVMIGPYDLSGSYGVPGQTNHELVLNASNKVVEACLKYGKSCGTQIAKIDTNSINEAFNIGYNFIILSSDLFILWQWAEDMKKIISKY
tara:strand:+ start:226 stop:1008 length:783 start_codon:yes stop_codon:yes gene_type:complete